MRGSINQSRQGEIDREDRLFFLSVDLRSRRNTKHDLFFLEEEEVISFENMPRNEVSSPSEFIY
jgi:hypothetical protein